MKLTDAPKTITLVRGAVALSGTADGPLHLDACSVDPESVQLAAAGALGLQPPVGKSVADPPQAAPAGARPVYDLALVRSDTGKADGFTPPKGVRGAAALGLEMRREHGRGGTEVGVARARDLSNGKAVSLDTIGRMVSYFARHEVDQQGEGWSPGEDGYPSAGRIAWLLWGGDPGRTWAESIWRRERADKADTTPGMEVQSLIFDKEQFPDRASVRAWVREHGFEVEEWDER